MFPSCGETPLPVLPAVALGMDLSTQSCKCVAVDASTLRILGVVAVEYDKQFPQYQTVHGMHRSSDDPPVVTSPTVMWAEAVVQCIDLMAAHTNHMRPIAISGSAQQHASVYWSIQHGDSVDAEDLARCLSVVDSPIWMNNTTEMWCDLLRRTFPGGDAGMQRECGVRATPRFSVFHVAAHKRTPASRATRAVGLASSFATSLLAGRLCGMDVADASGTGALCLHERKWSDNVFRALGIDDGRELFGSLLDPTQPLAWPIGDSAVGQRLWCRSLPASTLIVPFSGDNPCAVVGMGLMHIGDVVISLGTSDTCIVVGRRDAPTDMLPPCAYTFPHPLFPEELLCHMIVYANGDLARRRVRDRHCKGSWDLFSSALSETRSDGNLFRGLEGSSPLSVGMQLAVDEICPPITVSREGMDVLLEGGNNVSSVRDGRYYSRLCIEFRALCMIADMGSLLRPSTTDVPGRLLVTGGASGNQAILDVFADAFQRDVWVQETKEAAAFGAAIRAVWGVSNEDARTRLRDVIDAQCAGSKAASPICTGSVARATHLVQRIVSAFTAS